VDAPLVLAAAAHTGAQDGEFPFPQCEGQVAAEFVPAAGGRTLVRGGRVAAYDGGIAERTVVVEFDSFEQAVPARDSEAYQEALVALSDGVDRDFRIVEGID
jgi:uncharacterized protein (DUF1330 family)